MPPSPLHPHLAIVGCGAAGLFAAIHAARAAPPGTIVTALDGAKKIGAKILVAGGGRCNVTHYAVTEADYATSGSHKTVRNILRRFTVDDTVQFFRDQGVALKREDTGKLFPTTDSARTVLNALLDASRSSGARIIHPHRIASITRENNTFTITPEDPSLQTITARKVILCAGGKALPKSGSDGLGFSLAKSLGHSTTARISPALVPLKADAEKTFVQNLSGIALPATVSVIASSGKRLASFTDPVLCTHFGLSGPAILDVSRFLLDARATDPGASLVINWLPDTTTDALDQQLASLASRAVITFLRERLPERMAYALCHAAKLDPTTRGSDLRKDARRVLARALCECEIPIKSSRGFTFAEVTAGGIPLSEINPKTMESRARPGLYLAGEILDVDGRIGGFNFQWAWATGFIAGTSAARTLAPLDQ